MRLTRSDEQPQTGLFPTLPGDLGSYYAAAAAAAAVAVLVVP